MLLSRIQDEYRDMPGLTLTCLQAQRLWRMNEPTCRRVMQTLVETGFLTQTHYGFARSHAERILAPQFVPRQDRRQTPDRRAIWRGGRRSTDR